MNPGILDAFCKQGLPILGDRSKTIASQPNKQLSVQVGDGSDIRFLFLPVGDRRCASVNFSDSVDPGANRRHRTALNLTPNLHEVMRLRRCPPAFAL